ncbi:multicopper oxidase domain-containing protein [Acidobacteriia bacterium AH_259_A11_L15]|nr:multicopper oxidase domain-containing protein [Acidobacteriia bacterium AH_259_A11_L15]
MKNRTRMLLATVLVLAMAAGLLLWPPGREAADQADSSPQARAVAASHGRHLPPTKGSGMFQYATPTGRRFEASQVYDPSPPPSEPAPNGVREYTLVIEEDVPHEVAPGVLVPAWTFNRTVPGPVLRVTEGETLRVTLINKGKLPHTIHFHGIHPASMDGVFELVPPGGEFTYEFVARPYGVMPYHCHSMPTSQHIHNGLYGMVIVDPKEGRPPMRELAMVMSAFDLDRDGEAEFYAWNGRAFQYADNPVELAAGEPVRMYVMNIFEEAMVPHLHGNLYQLYPSGTTLTPTEFTDVKTLSIAERAILEFTYDYPGHYMFQCHVTEHMEQGLMGWFRVVEDETVARRTQK